MFTGPDESSTVILWGSWPSALNTMLIGWSAVDSIALFSWIDLGEVALLGACVGRSTSQVSDVSSPTGQGGWRAGATDHAHRPALEEDLVTVHGDGCREGYGFRPANWSAVHVAWR